MRKQNTFCKIGLFIFVLYLINSTVFAQPQKMDINQTLSDEAQRTTIAFSGLAFLTGEEESYTFLPPGKLADYFGFQYLRDNDLDRMGHNTDFLTKASNNILSQLNDSQKAELIALAKAQVQRINDYGYARFPLIHAFRRLLIKDLPKGATGLDSSKVMTYSADLFKIDGIISYQRAKLYGNIIKSFNQAQKDSLNKLTAVGMLSWPSLPDQIDKRTLSHDEDVAVMTFASDIFSWYARSVEADVYFCPERQATYFGGFYMKDMPAMGNPNYSIDTNLTADKGKALLNTLDAGQRKEIEDIVLLQKPTLLAIVAKREEISNTLRGFWLKDDVDSLGVLKLSEDYGKLDGLLAYWYASRFASVGWSLTDKQKDSLIALRDLKNYPASKPFLFSDTISWPQIMNTDFLFNQSQTGVPNTNETSSNNIVYPNPASDFIFLPALFNEIKIYDFMGKEVLSLNQVNSRRIDISGLIPGLYFLWMENNNLVQYWKIIKE